MPVNNPIDVGSIMAQTSQVMKQVDVAKTVISANAAAVQSSYEQTASRYQQIGTSAALQETTKGLGQLQVEQAIAHSALDLGADFQDTMGLQRQDAADLLEAQRTRKEALQSINEKRNVGFFDDPLAWITNQFTINDDIDKYNSADAMADDAEKRMSERSKALDTEYQNFIRQKVTVTNASIAAAAEQAKNISLIQADEASRQALLTNSRSVQELVSLSGQQLQAQVTAYDAKVKQTNVQIALDHLALSREEFDWKRLQKQKGESADQYVIDTINTGLKVLDPNQPPLDINSPKAIALIQGKVPLDGLLKRAFELGETNRKLDPSGKSTRIIGATPVDTLQTLQYKPNLAPDQKAAVNLLTSAAAEVQVDPKYKELVAAKDIAGANNYMNEKVKEAFARQAEIVNSPDNVYYLPAASELIKQTPGLSQLPFVAKILNPAIKAGVPTRDPSQVFALGLVAVQKGEITLNQFAIDYATMYKQGQRINI